MQWGVFGFGECFKIPSEVLAQTIVVHLDYRNTYSDIRTDVICGSLHVNFLTKSKKSKAGKSHFYKYDIITLWPKHSARSSIW